MDGTRAKRTFGAFSLAVALGGGAWVGCTGDIDGGIGGARSGDSNRPGVLGPVGPGGSSTVGPGGSALPGGSAGAGGGASGSGAVDPGGGAPPGIGTTFTTHAVGESPLRRLSHAEYDDAVRDLLGDTSRPGRAVARDTADGWCDNTSSQQTVPELLAEQ
jgi:hypothetical protein